MIDPQINPRIIVPVLIALVLAFVLLRLGRADGRLQWAVLAALGLVIVFFLLSRTPLF